MRLDKYVSEKYNLPRNLVSKLIKEDKILVNNQKEKASYEVSESDEIKVLYEKKGLEFEDKPLEILYEDSDMLIINKESNLVVHPVGENKENTLVNRILKYPLSNLDETRPGIVHRLDKDTSGVIVIAKNDKFHLLFQEMLKERKVEKGYVALVEGVFKNNFATINLPLKRNFNNLKVEVQKDGKEAITEVKVLERFKDKTYLELKILTGRTHQIRSHLAYINYPIVNDPLYGTSFSSFGQYLHARRIKFKHPITNKLIDVTAPLPTCFKEYLLTLKKDNIIL